MFYRHSYDKLIYPLIAFVGLVAISYQPRYHLRSDMPAEFARAAPLATSGEKRSLDQKIAWAYWESVQMDVQWKYPHGHGLPVDPPAEFRVDARALGPVAADPATRRLYWQRLQEIWYAPGTWQKQYEWSWGWASDPLTSSGQWLKEKAEAMFSKL